MSTVFQGTDCPPAIDGSVFPHARRGSGGGAEADFNAGLAPFLFNLLGQLLIAPAIKEELLRFFFTAAGLDGLHVVLHALGVPLAVHVVEIVGHQSGQAVIQVGVLSRELGIGHVHVGLQAGRLKVVPQGAAPRIFLAVFRHAGDNVGTVGPEVEAASGIRGHPHVFRGAFTEPACLLGLRGHELVRQFMDEGGGILVAVNDVRAPHGLDAQGIKRDQDFAAVSAARRPQENACRAFTASVFQVRAELFVQVGGEFGGIVVRGDVADGKRFVRQVGGLEEKAQALDHAGAQLGVADEAEMGRFINILPLFLLDGFHLEIVLAFDGPGPWQVVIVRGIGGGSPSLSPGRDEIPVFPGKLGEGDGDGLAARAFQHGFLAVQPDELGFQAFPLDAGPGAPLREGKEGEGAQGSRHQVQACGILHKAGVGDMKESCC